MKSSGPELGNLSSRFFSYAHLKKKQIIRTGDISPVLGISASQERDLFRRLSKSGWIVRLKRGVYLVPLRLPAGGRYSPGIGLVLQKLMEENHGTYQICGPTAFHFYGFDEQIPTVTYVYNNRISGNKTIGNISFQFIKTADNRLGDIHIARANDGIEIIYSSKPRTLMDAVYDWSRFNSLPRGYDWIKNEIAKDTTLGTKLANVTSRYGNQATIRRVGYLLDSIIKVSKDLGQLLDQLSQSKSLIPWIPNIPARGMINRKWGIIINE